MRTRRAHVVALFGVAALLVLAAGCSGSDSEDSAEPRPSDTPAPAISLVVIGDSIPYNSSSDCPGCTGFVERYAESLAEATGREVETQNLSQHTA